LIKPNNLNQKEQTILDETQKWLHKVVLGLNLCPFAHEPVKQDKVKYLVSHELAETAIIRVLHNELIFLNEKTAKECETTLIILSDGLKNFLDYNDFLAMANDYLANNDWDGVFQIASFHPYYCFANTQPNDPENLTNRSPYPIIQILREETLSNAIDQGIDTEAIYKRNIERMKTLSTDEINELFG